MAPPGSDSTSSVALFCTALPRPSDPWLRQACAVARENDENEPAHSLDEVSEVDCTGWPMEQVAEWAVNHLTAQDDPRTSRSFVVADNKSEQTDSLVIVSLDPSSFGANENIRIEGTIRAHPSWCSILPVLFHSDIQGIDKYADNREILSPR